MENECDTVGVRVEVPRELHEALMLAKVRSRRQIRELVLDALMKEYLPDGMLVSRRVIRRGE